MPDSSKRSPQGLRKTGTDKEDSGRQSTRTKRHKAAHDDVLSSQRSTAACAPASEDEATADKDDTVGTRRERRRATSDSHRRRLQEQQRRQNLKEAMDNLYATLLKHDQDFFREARKREDRMGDLKQSSGAQIDSSLFNRVEIINQAIFTIEHLAQGADQTRLHASTVGNSHDESRADSLQRDDNQTSGSYAAKSSIIFHKGVGPVVTTEQGKVISHSEPVSNERNNRIPSAQVQQQPGLQYPTHSPKPVQTSALKKEVATAPAARAIGASSDCGPFRSSQHHQQQQQHELFGGAGNVSLQRMLLETQSLRHLLPSLPNVPVSGGDVLHLQQRQQQQLLEVLLASTMSSNSNIGGGTTLYQQQADWAMNTPFFQSWLRHPSTTMAATNVFQRSLGTVAATRGSQYQEDDESHEDDGNE